MSIQGDIFHHKVHTGGPLPNMCEECDLSLAWAERDRLKAELEKHDRDHVRIESELVIERNTQLRL